ncbi:MULTISPECIES: ribonuclease H family protein [Bacteroides]|uniref:Ribonuclease H n=2 Tax=Bacteroidaceae TaxID=815 RepID=A0ABT7VGR7_9BACE|nr:MULTISPECIES: ribonuclease H family protein [Bacteroides]MBU3856866.1 ribonuclease H family protein [Candidatus Phocaeicola excrementipullorum]MBW9198909.1 ribonuclease H [Bacteroidales bacterium SW299]MCR8916721.1 ribonuclease H family protein [Bacteroides sp. ET225]MDM8207367.1 ribonuclease H family protein [Bacteroides gallinaceum]MDM8325501.1 ribonuclease H family protein [Bacteroides gallinaceum]
MAKPKFYTVWKGVCPGVYSSWQDCQQQIKGFKGAMYKSFSTKEEAERALEEPAHLHWGAQAQTPPLADRLPEGFNTNCLAVDAACSGNPGPMEYRGVYLATGEQIFHYGPVYGTNNIGEFLAIVHGLALLKQKNLQMPVYSDSRNALNWVKQKQCKTKLERTDKTEALFQLIGRAEKWLKENSTNCPVLKWETDRWGEIPADFGRK